MRGSIEARVNVLVVTAALAVGAVGGTGWASVAALRQETGRLFDVQAKADGRDRVVTAAHHPLLPVGPVPV